MFRSVGGDPDAKREELKRIFRHELGHFLGLADYGAGCWRLVDAGGAVKASLMSYGQLQDRDSNPLLQPDGPADPTALDPPGCGSAAITSRDLDDLHAIYHPHAVTGLSLRHNADGSSVLSWNAPEGTPSEYNAASLGIFQRALHERNPVSGVRSGVGLWSLITRIAPTEDDHMLPGDVGGWQYAVAGLTGGDHQRGSGATLSGLQHGTVTVPLPDPPGGSRTWALGEPSDLVSASAPFGSYGLGFDGFAEMHFGQTGAGQFRFSGYSSPRTVSGIPVGAGDMVIAYEPASSTDPDPFEPADLMTTTINFGYGRFAFNGCRTRGFRDGRYLCHLGTSIVNFHPDLTPLRIIVTRAGAGITSPLVGTYELDRNIAGFVNYGATAPGEWRLAFWGRDLNVGVTHGGPVPLRSGDIVLSHAEPWGPNGFADSPFAPIRFTPLRISHGTTAIDAASCTTHFYNVDRYECHIAGAFTFDDANIPTDITVNPGTTTTSRDTRDQPGQDTPAQPLTTCTTSDLDCGQTDPSDQQSPNTPEN